MCVCMSCRLSGWLAGCGPLMLFWLRCVSGACPHKLYTCGQQVGLELEAGGRSLGVPAQLGLVQTERACEVWDAARLGRGQHAQRRCRCHILSLI